jgi:hypothetical protein
VRTWLVLAEEALLLLYSIGKPLWLSILLAGVKPPGRGSLCSTWLRSPIDRRPGTGDEA